MYYQNSYSGQINAIQKITLTLRHYIHVSPTQMSRPHSMCVRACTLLVSCVSHLQHATVPKVLEHARRQFALQRRERSTEIERPKEPKSESRRPNVGGVLRQGVFHFHQLWSEGQCCKLARGFQGAAPSDMAI